MFKFDKDKKFDLLTIIVLFILALFLADKYIQNDAFYSIKIGEDILKYGVDMLDHYSFHNLPYTYPHWLFDVLLYLIYSLFGIMGMYGLNIVFLFLLGVLLYYVGIHFNKNRFFSCLFAILSLFFMRQFVAGRAQTFSYILFILEILCVENYLKSGKNKYFIFLSLILLLIFNMHIAVWPMFYIFLLPYIFEYFLASYKSKKINNKYLKKKKNVFINNETGFYSDRFIFEKNDNVKNIMIFIPFSLLIGLITPLGMNAYTYIFKTFMGNSMSYISEHQPPFVIDSIELLFMLISIIIVLAFTKAKFKFRDFAMLGGLILMALSSYRHIALFSIMWVLLFGRGVAEYINKIDKKGLDNAIKLFTKNVYFGLAIIFTILVGYLNFPLPNYDIMNDLVPADEYPIEASEFILKELDYKNIRLFNYYDYGSYLLFKGIPVYMDSRADLYTKEFNGKKDYMDEGMNCSFYNYKDLIKENDITHILIYADSPMYHMYDDDINLTQIYKDDYFLMYEVIGEY